MKSHSKPHEHPLSTFPSSEAWRLGMEVTRQDEGPEAFHRGERPEPGYMLGFQNGIKLMLTTLGTRLSADLLAEMHDICVAAIDDQYLEKEKTSYRDKGGVASYRLLFVEEDPKLANVTKDGFYALLNKVSEGEKTALNKNRIVLGLIKLPQETPYFYNSGDHIDSDEIYAKIKSGKYIPVIFSGMDTPENIKKRTQDYIDEFYQRIEKVKTNDEKDELIIKVIQDIEQLHPFPDANARTITMIALNKLFIDYGLDPVMLDNPNRLDGYSLPELKKEIQKGRENFKAYTVGILLDHLDSLSLDLLDTHLSKQPFAAMAQLNALHAESDNQQIQTLLANLYLGKIKTSFNSDLAPKSSDVYMEVIAKHGISKTPEIKEQIEKLVKNKLPSKPVVKTETVKSAQSPEILSSVELNFYRLLNWFSPSKASETKKDKIKQPPGPGINQKDS